MKTWCRVPSGKKRDRDTSLFSYDGEKNLDSPWVLCGEDCSRGVAGKRACAPVLAQTVSGSSRYPAASSHVSHCKHLIMGRGYLNPTLIPSLIAGLSGNQLASSRLKMFQMCRERTVVYSLSPEMSLHHFSLVI